ncbi:hypothetical protein DL768_004691 [Monosporascus sp. mg162]|nr:hypothetical protein DL768_004691 [Monosporascus sp. mg162]
MTSDGADTLLAGTVHVREDKDGAKRRVPEFEHQGQHLLGIMPETFTTAACASKNGECPWDETAWRRSVLERAGEAGAPLSRADEIASERRLPRGLTRSPTRATSCGPRPPRASSCFTDAAWAMFEAAEGRMRTGLADSAPRRHPHL